MLNKEIGILKENPKRNLRNEKTKKKTKQLLQQLREFRDLKTKLMNWTLQTVTKNK